MTPPLTLLQCIADNMTSNYVTLPSIRDTVFLNRKAVGKERDQMHRLIQHSFSDTTGAGTFVDDDLQHHLCFSEARGRGGNGKNGVEGIRNVGISTRLRGVKKLKQYGSLAS
jgi:hypothetical protein